MSFEVKFLAQLSAALAVIVIARLESVSILHMRLHELPPEHLGVRLGMNQWSLLLLMIVVIHLTPIGKVAVVANHGSIIIIMRQWRQELRPLVLLLLVGEY